MQYIFGSSASSSGACASGIPALPVITSDSATYAVSTADDTQVIYEAVSGDNLPYAGSIMKANACDELSLVITYLVKSNACDACAVDTNTADDLQELAEPIVIPAGVPGITLPAGYIAKIEGTVTGGSAKGNTVTFMSSRAGQCTEVTLA